MRHAAEPLQERLRDGRAQRPLHGCGRTLDEIALWSVLDDDDKRAVWALLPARLAALPPAAAGSPQAPA